MRAIVSAVQHNPKVTALIQQEPGLRDLGNVEALAKIFVLMDEDNSGDVDFLEFYNFFTSFEVEGGGAKDSKADAPRVNESGPSVGPPQIGE